MKLLKLYDNEKYILMLDSQGDDLKVVVSFKVYKSNHMENFGDYCYLFRWLLLNISLQVGASSMTVLRSIWQSYWLDKHGDAMESVVDQLARSLSEMENKFNDFVQLLEGAGWDTHQLSLKVPNSVLIDVS